MRIIVKNNCKLIQKLIVPFEQNELLPSDEENFLTHVNNCKDCKEELEIHYIISYGLEDEDESAVFDKQYQDLLDRYDFKELVELKLKNSRKKLDRIYAWNRFIRICRITANLCCLGAFVIFLIICFC